MAYEDHGVVAAALGHPNRGGPQLEPKRVRPAPEDLGGVLDRGQQHEIGHGHHPRPVTVQASTKYPQPGKLLGFVVGPPESPRGVS